MIRNKSLQDFELSKLPVGLSKPPPLQAHLMLVQQIKIFKSVDTEIPEMERQINRWMRKSGARVLSISGNLASNSSGSGGPLHSFAAGDVLIIVHYEVDAPTA